jgi:hypothetical protein
VVNDEQKKNLAMDDIFELVSDINQQFFADSQRRSQFHRKVHKKYNATYYYQVIDIDFSSYSVIQHFLF